MSDFFNTQKVVLTMMGPRELNHEPRTVVSVRAFVWFIFCDET